MSSKIKGKWTWPRDMTFPNYWRKAQRKIQGKEGWAEAVRKAKKDPKRYLTRGLQESKDDTHYYANIMQNVFHVGILMEEVVTFSFSKNLLNALRETDVRNLPSSVVKVPFPVMYFDLSQGDLLPTLKEDEKDDPTNLRHPRGCAVLQMGNMGDFSDFTLMPLSYLPKKPVNKKNTLMPYIASFMGLRSENDEFRFLDEMVGMDESDKEILTISLNALLYINSANSDVREEWVYAPNLRGKTKLLKKLEKQKQRQLGKVHNVGYRVQLPQHCDIATGKGEGGRKLDIRFRVRGHWRHQWYGPRKNAEGQKQKGDKQELIWIPPCWKGPEMADVVHRDYAVKEKPTMEQ